MDKNRKFGKHLLRRILGHHIPAGIILPVAAGLSFSLNTGCMKPVTQRPFDAGKCMEIIPDKVDGLTILSGPRTKQSIIRDLVWPICNARVLYDNMKRENSKLGSGSAVFKVRVEYTGEVQEVFVDKTNLASEEFLSSVRKMIQSTDFVFWGQDTTDTVFLYPIHFNG